MPLLRDERRVFRHALDNHNILLKDYLKKISSLPAGERREDEEEEVEKQGKRRMMLFQPPSPTRAS
jgi:hypothetical protein